MYRQIYGLSLLPAFQGFEAFFLRGMVQFRRIYDSANPHEEPLPEPWNSQLDEFQKLIFVKSFRPDKVIPCVQNWIALKIGK